MSKLSKLTLGAMLVALQIIFVRFIYILTPGNLDRLSFSFIPDALAGCCLGPLYAMLYGVSADILGMLVNSAGTTFTPLFTLIAALKGLAYGLFFHKKQLTLKRIICTFIFMTLIFDLGLTPIALMTLYGKSFQAVVIMKIPVQIVFCVVKIVTFYVVSKPLSRLIKK
ncbi:MAG: folate family ECF transporter S component [Clostridia bacterium]|nr:folate family ECF transporter S component [Clostridia bacterium]